MAQKDHQIEVVAINVRSQTPQQAAYLCKYDSVYGRFDGTVDFGEDCIAVNGKKIRLFQIEDPAKLSWGGLKVDVVVEATGVFRDAQKAGKHLQAGARRVLITAPAKGEIPTIVWGVNEKIYDKTKHALVSAASCTTNCLAPVAYILHKEFGIKKGLMTTVHAYTGSQNLVDGSNKDMVEGRAAAINIIPTTTGAASAIGLVIPELNGKLDGMAFRVPVATGSVTDLVAELEKAVTVEQINETFKRYANGSMKAILGVSEWPLVSSDCVGDSRSAIVDLTSTKVIEKNMAKVVAFYDNEWGYSARLVDLVKYL
jgi:glyceraldehyde 3-phosphate dehydrogenase